MFSDIVYKLTKFLALPEIPGNDLGDPKKILIIRQHNQLGDLLAGVPLLRALKEKYPNSKINILLGPQNFYGYEKNGLIDSKFVFDKKQLFNPAYFVDLKNFLNQNYDLTIVPVTVSISFTSNLLARFSDGKIKIGPAELNGKINKSAFLFNKRIVVDWRKYPDANVSDIGLEIIRPFNVKTNNFRSLISYDINDLTIAKKFINDDIKLQEGESLVGLHPGAGKNQNKWSLLNFIQLIFYIKENFNCKFYLTGSNTDDEELDYLIKNIPFRISVFKNQSIPEVAALVSLSDLFITNDTGIMHVAGATDTPQISIFGPTNPFNWAPVGSNKFFLRKSDLIDELAVEEVYSLAASILDNPKGIVDEK